MYYFSSPAKFLRTGIIPVFVIAFIAASLAIVMPAIAAAPPITDFVVFADNKLSLWKDVTIEGDVGCNCSFAIPSGTTIEGNVYSTGTITNMGTVTGTITQNGAPVTMPAPTIFSAGGPDVINTPTGQTTTLVPGSYDVVNLGKKHTLNLSSGNYFLTSLSVDEHSTTTLAAAGGLNMFVDGNAFIGKGMDFVVTNGTPTDIYFEVHGKLFFASAGGGAWFGQAYVPFNVLHIGHETINTGTFYARQIQIEEYALVRAFVSPPPPFSSQICLGYEATIWVENGIIHGGPMDGRPYNGFINGTEGSDVIIGIDGTGIRVEQIDGKGGDDIICAGAGFDDIIKGGTGNDMIDGGSGQNEIDGQDGDDTIFGGSGLDGIKGGNGDDTVWGGSDRDIIEGNFGNDEIHGGDGNDLIKGQQDFDTLFGDDGNDTIEGGNGNDMIFGGEGDDVVQGDMDDDTIDGGPGNDTLSGDADNDVLSGGLDDDTLFGGPGDDVLDGGPGDDVLEGQGDTDFCSNGETVLSCP